MDFGFNQEQELLRATARKFFESECTSEFVRAILDHPRGARGKRGMGHDVGRNFTSILAVED